MTGDGSAEPDFEALLLRYQPQLVAFIRAKAGPNLRRREGLSDLVQTVCAELLADRSRFEYRSEAEFRSWLFGRALHKVINKAKFHGAERRAVAREVDPSTTSGEDLAQRAYATLCTPSREAVGREELFRLEGAIDDMPADQREALVLRKFLGLDYDQIAMQMERSQSAVRKLVHRAVARLVLLTADQ